MFWGRSSRSRRGLSGCRSDRQARYSDLALATQENLFVQRSTTLVRLQCLRFQVEKPRVFYSIVAGVQIHP